MSEKIRDTIKHLTLFLLATLLLSMPAVLIASLVYFLELLIR